MGFRHHPNTLQIPFPFKGINTNSKNDVSSARFIQNILVADNQAGTLRYGTSFVASFEFQQTAIFQKILAIMPFFKNDGTSEKLVYATYLYQSNITEENSTIEENESNGWTKVTLNANTFQPLYWEYLTKAINDKILIFFEQGISFEIEITLISKDQDNIVFHFPIAIDQIGNQFQIYIERGLIAKLEPEGFNIINNSLDPLVIVSHLNFQGKLIIANGVDHVLTYDGATLTPLKGPVAIPNINQITIGNLSLTFTVPTAFIPTLQADLHVNDQITLISQDIKILVFVTAITFNGAVVTINIDSAPPVNIRKIIYYKLIPSFSSIVLIQKRLWATAEGRTYQFKFRPPSLAMRAYYADKVESIEDWFNEKTNDIGFIDLSSESMIPDNLECIMSFEGKTVFLGRETTQIWIGSDPTTHDDGQNISLPDFQWEQTLPIGVIQRNLVVEIPNNLIFLSKYGLITLSSLNINRQFQVSYQFAIPINSYVNSQMNFVENDREFRNMHAFLYPYGKFLGFRIKYSCFIYQLNAEGSWVVFSENFAESNSVLYDPTTQDLYLGLDGAILLKYSDKIGQQSYEEYGKGRMSWLVVYNWTDFSSTWSNTNFYFDGKTLQPLQINIRIYLDYDETQSINENLIIDQEGALFDISFFGSNVYPFNKTYYSHEIIRFSADAFMLSCTGLSDSQLTFNRFILAGGEV